MKCPKCQFVGFDGLDECQKCGYNFVTKKGGKKFSFLSRIMETFSGDDDQEPVAKKIVAVVEPEEAAGEPLPADEMAPEPVSKLEQAADAEVAEEDEDGSFDNKFDDLFGDDKTAVKGGGDAIMITATDSHSEGTVAEDEMADMHDYGGFDPYSEVVVPPDDNDAIFESGDDEPAEPEIDITNDIPDDTSAVEPEPAAGTAYGEVALEDDAAATDFLKGLASKSDSMDDES